jgi:sugar phosphate isomerase/epimerase
MDMSRVSSCTICLHDRALGEALDIISAAGFKNIDLLARLPHFSVNPVECDHDAIERMVAERGMQIANLGTYEGSSFASASKDECESGLVKLKNAIDLAVRFGARSIRITPGRPESPARFDRIVPYFQRSAEYAESKGIYMGIENHGGAISGNPELLVDLCHRVGSKYFGVLYEPANLMAAGVEYQSAFDIMRHCIVHIHIKDGKHVEGKWRGTMLGEGELNLNWIVASLKSIDYDGFIALEYEVNHIEPPETGLKKWYTVFENI